MSDDNWARISALFDEGLELSPTHRNAWLREQCADDHALRAKLERMFHAHDSPGLLDRPLTATPTPRDPAELFARVSRALRDRYNIRGTLGAGGMSTVFQAHECKHDRSVVIKVLEPDFNVGIGAERFLDEVRIAAKLSHPHILKLIDSGSCDGLLFYVMPYVGGESMRERLLRDGAQPLRETVGLLRDIADALSYAHDAGVVHRDLKPENVLCLEGHAFLLDFGIAKIEADQHRTNSTNPGLRVGTPGYMAPEQAAGLRVDHRADVYAWGLLARELLTGSQSPEPALSTARPDVPRALLTLVEACLAIDPAERPQSARMLVKALDALSTPRPRRRWWPVALFGALALMLGVLWARRAPERPANGTVVGPIAVMPLVNETADTTLAGWGRLAGDWITQGLHEAGLLPVVPWPSMMIATSDLANSRTDPIALVHRQTGAATVVTGSYYRIGDSLRFQASITDARNGELLAAIPPVTVSKDSASSAVRELRERLMGAIALSFDERLPAKAAANDHPPLWEAYRLFDQGLNEYNAYHYREATKLMIEAWHRDTTFTPALIYAAVATLNNGDPAAGDSVIKMALERRASLSAYHAALADFIEAYLTGDRSRSLEPIMRAIALAPGSRAAYHAAYVLLQLNRPMEADSLLRTLDPDHGPMRAWPSFWSQRAYCAHLTGRYLDELALAREMKRRFPDQRVAWVIEARALASLGSVASLDSLYVAASTLDPDVYWSQGAMRQVAAEELSLHQRGDSTAAYQEAARWLEARLKDHPRDRNHRSWLSQAMLGLGRFDRAEQLLDDLDREGPERLYHRGQLATLAARRGNAPLAARRLAASPTSSPGELAVYEARVAALLGNSEEAIAKLSEALRLGVSNWHWMQHEMQRDLSSLRNDARYQRLLQPIAPASR